MKPSTVDRTTTKMVQITVFFSTMVNLELPSTFWKLANPAKPLIRPDLVIWLKAMRKTKPMGMIMKIAIRMTLGRIHR